MMEVWKKLFVVLVCLTCSISLASTTDQAYSIFHPPLKYSSYNAVKNFGDYNFKTRLYDFETLVNDKLNKILYCTGKYTCKVDPKDNYSIYKCIPRSEVCDGTINCPMKDDEENCPVKCNGTEMVCDENVCAKVCDGIKQCQNGNDEQNCACKNGEVKCPSGMCGDRCNGIVECTGFEDKANDEKGCLCPNGTVRCPSGKCGMPCNGVTECNGEGDHNDDEKQCACESGQIKCPSGKCANYCDGPTECDGDGDNAEDEKNCPCPANMIRCKNGETCGTLCNMMQDCPDGEDEDPLKCPCPGGNIRCPSGLCGVLCDDATECVGTGDASEDQVQCACPVGNLHCPSGLCASRCDETPQCTEVGIDNGEDEMGCCCPAGSTRCPGGECAVVCDGEVQCTNVDLDKGEDELHCDCPFHCANGMCGNVCDGIPDCPNEEDEAHCRCDVNMFQCPSGKCAGICAEPNCDGPGDALENLDLQFCRCPIFHVRCTSGKKCGRLCDGIVDCDDPLDQIDDERNCLDMIFRLNPGINRDPTLAWSTGENTLDTFACKNIIPGSCGFHYRDGDLIDNWPNEGITEVRVSIYKDGIEQQWLLFDGSGTTITDWFHPDNLIASSWEQLTDFTFTNVNAPYADNSAVFEIRPGEAFNRLWQVATDKGTGNGCTDMQFYLLVARGTGPCTFDMLGGDPYILYWTEKDTAPDVTMPGSYEQADALVVSIRQ